MYALFFVGALVVLLSFSVLGPDAAATGGGARLSGAAAIDTLDRLGARPGLAVAAVETLARRHAAATAYAAANPGYAGPLTDATLQSANYLPQSWSNPYGATSQVDATRVATWLASGPGGLTQADLLTALIAQSPANAPLARSIGRISAAGGGFVPVAMPTTTLALPAGAAAPAAATALMTRVR